MLATASAEQIYVRVCRVHAKIVLEETRRALRRGGMPQRGIKKILAILDDWLYRRCEEVLDTHDYDLMLAEEKIMFPAKGSVTLFGLARNGRRDMGPVGEDYNHHEEMRKWRQRVRSW